MREVTIYTDGSCTSGVGRGGWAVLILQSGEGLNYVCTPDTTTITGSEDDTTCNRMELTALIAALKSLDDDTKATIHCDSKYVVDGYNSWMDGWRLDKGRPSYVKNKDLWIQLQELKATLADRIVLQWIKGHSNNHYNDAVDALAKEAKLNHWK
jgi:ribonuclease HI